MNRLVIKGVFRLKLVKLQFFKVGQSWEFDMIYCNLVGKRRLFDRVHRLTGFKRGLYGYGSEE